MNTGPFHQFNIVGIALKAQSMTNNTFNGETISEPQQLGRYLSFLWGGGAFAATVNGDLKIQGQKRSDSAWEDLTFADASVMRFPLTKFDDGGAAEGGALLGTVDLRRFDATTYKAIRCVFVESGNAAALGAVIYVISDLFQTAPATQVDELFALQRSA